MNNEELIAYYLRQIEEEQNAKAGNSYDKLRGYSNKANNFGYNLKTTGNFLKDNVNSEFAKKIGVSMDKLGTNITNGTKPLADTLNKPVNYFKGQANGALKAGLQKLGLANTTAAGAGAGAAGAGTTAAATGATGATTAGTVAGTTAAGTAAGTGAAAGGAAAGAGAAGAGAAGGAAGAAGGSAAAGAGAAAGGSAASAALGPIAALAVMALMGTNRKRAKKSGRALMGMTNDIVKQGQDEQLANTQQSTAALQEEANQALQNGIATGGASNIFNGNVQPNPIQDPISLYQESLRQQGFSDDVVNGVRQGLNSGNKEIDQWIQQYNSGAGRENPINIPQTEEEITAARDGVFNVPTQVSNVASEDFESKVKQGLLDKFIDGITDLSKGYNENRNTAFNPENLRRRQDLATFKQSVNPADYTTKLTPDEQKQFDIWANDMRAKGAINPNDKFQDYDMQGYWKNEVLNNTDLANGNAEAHFTDKYKMPNHETFSNESIYATGDNAKYAGHWDNNNYVTPLKNNKMTRAGEILGTISRAAQKPAVQALLAGSISTALTGNPLYGVGMAQKFGANRVMTDVYRDILAKQGINVDPRMFGAIGAKDFDAIMLPELKKALYSNQAERIANDRWYKEHKIDIDQQNADSNSIKAGAAKTKADKYNGGGKGNTTAEPSGQYVIGETPNGRQVKVPIEKVKEFKSNGGKIVG